MTKLFVYGTLQRGHRLNDVLEGLGAEFECQATTVKHYSMLYGGQQSPGMFPVVLNPVNGSPAAPIVGEVYRLPNDFDWEYLDRIEAAYDRTVISENNNEPVYLYVGKPARWQREHDEFTSPHTDGNIYWMLPT